MGRQVALVCGIAASVLYLAMNVFIPMQWDGYSSASQTVSELSAIGAPTRPLWVPLGLLYGLTDALHIAFAVVALVLMFLEIGFGAAALDRRFRLYSIATIVGFVVCGALTFVDAPKMAANLPTPWIGVWERINIAAYLLWVIVLAVVLLRAPAAQAELFRGGNPE